MLWEASKQRRLPEQRRRADLTASIAIRPCEHLYADFL
jgi:hypothetical protein